MEREVGEMTSSVRIYRDPRDLTADELNRIIFSVLRREYPKKVRRVVSYITMKEEELMIIADNPQSLAQTVLRRLQVLESEKKVEWTPDGWKLK